MKKIVSLVLAISMVLSMFVSAFAATSRFEDVDSEYAGAVEALVELGVINGLPDGTYGPEKEVTRAQLAKMLVICLGLGDTVESLAGRTVFTDVADSHWASGYINAAVQSKVIAGYPDGTFKPEKNVSNAEAVTMVIRALGYGNVVDKEGTWPTAYMLKAIELELLDGMSSTKAGDAALRGDTAVLLWNMLTTQMWKIYEESEGSGMTSSTGDYMLNVKFPKYTYMEKEAYVTAVSVEDGEAWVTVNSQKAKVEDVDLPRVLVGMQVTALVKDYKDSDKATFLTLTPVNEIVEGIVTDVTAKKIEVNDKKYSYDNALVITEADENEAYVVFEVEGSKLTDTDLVTLPRTGKEVEKIKAMENAIDEDALVIIDGEWATRDDIEIGDVYTEIDAPTSGVYYMVARERVEGTFESLTKEHADEDRMFLEVDGKEYDAFYNVLAGEMWEDEDNDKLVDIDFVIETKKKDNKYLDQEVELVLNYLGEVVKVYFGEVSDLDADGEFYVVMSNGAWASSSASGKQYHIVLTGVDGEEETYNFEKNVTIPAELAEDAVYAGSGDPIFVWANLNDNGEIKKIAVLENGLTSGDANGYKGDYSIYSFAGEMDDDNNTLATTAAMNSGDMKVTASTIVVTATPVKDEDDEKVIGYEVEVSQGTEALEGVTEGLVAHADGKAPRAKFVFVAAEAKSQELNFGKVEKATINRGIVYATISGVEYKVDLEATSSIVADLDDVKALYDSMVAFTIDDDEIIIKKAYTAADLDLAGIVIEIDDEFVKYEVRSVSGSQDASGNTVYTGTVLDTDTIDTTAKATKEAYEDYTFVRGSVTAEKDTNKAIFDADVEVLGEGIEGVTFKKGDRFSIDSTNEVFVIVSGVDYDEDVVDGVIVAGATIA